MEIDEDKIDDAVLALLWHHAAIHHAHWRGRLHNDTFAAPACIAQPDRPFDPDSPRQDSSASLTSVPMQCSSNERQGQTLLSGSMTSS